MQEQVNTITEIPVVTTEQQDFGITQIPSAGVFSPVTMTLIILALSAAAYFTREDNNGK